ncbi:U3 snoRNP protein [Heterostelium album PN500]|uniref:U3 snoRNP protein n=1 Tax=Heterostelium pallidum (strain ATCC 26659 / Pp 5 / PN500) TaxID=670386 RepID=D3BV59_HETP5|nr:U3 snoRNP protein [Heterostelium album PN500]EFA74997.1 U3 snoRNP protein [Heterostelium album PN500]|eukprot:XP_020427131.1 U3 snoRNP protein [Heterostelium album PN500]
MVGTSKSDKVFSQKKGAAASSFGKPQQQQQQQHTPSVKIVNPFDRKTNRVKHSVLGKKVVGTSGNRGQSRYNDIERRKKTLLVELNQSKKSNQFLDQRIAENDPTMSEEDKMLARYQKEKMKKNLYNLNDDDDQLIQGGLGDHLADDYVADEDDELREEERMSGGRRRNIYEQDEERDENGEPIKKTREEVFQEIIEKSKAGRAERAKEKMLKEDITRELDQEFDEIRSGSMLMMRGKDDPLLSLFPTSEEEQKRQQQQKEKENNKDQQQKEKEKQQPAQQNEDDFDNLVLEMANEARAKATDRTKTPEEVMKEEKERLDKLEENRLKRMRGEIVEEDDESAKKMTRYEKRQKKLKKDKTNLPSRPTADDLNDDDFALDDPLGNKDAPWYDFKENGEGEEDGEDEDEDEESEDGDQDDDEELDGEDDDEDEEGVEEEEDDDDEESEDEDDIEASRIEAEIRKINSQKKASEEIPFTFDVPKSIDELNQWLAGRTQEEKNLIYTRIRVCNHVSLKPQNKEKMKVYLPVLWRRFELIAANNNNNNNAEKDSSSLDWLELDLLAKYIFEVGKDVPDILAATALAMMHSCYKRCLARIEKVTVAAAANNNATTTTTVVSAWPSVSELLTMKLIANVFPTSDFQHQVVTPTTVAMAHFLIQLPIITPHDILSSIFLSNIFKYYLVSANKYSPEITSVVISLLSSFASQQKTAAATATAQTKTNKDSDQWASFNTGILVPNMMLKDKCLAFANKKTLKKVTPATQFDFNYLIKSKQEQSQKYFGTDQFRIDLLYLLLNFVESYVKQMILSENTESLPSVLQLFLNQLNQFDSQLFNQVLQDKLKLVKDLIGEKNKSIVEKRVPLTLLVGKPVEKKTFTPSFSKEYHEHGDDPDVVRQEARKLKALHKKEMKGAIRELIKDNNFIQQEKTKQRMAERQEIEIKRKKIMSELEQEQHEHKQYKKMKDRLDGRI